MAAATGGGASSDSVASQCCAVPGTASLAEPEQAGTSNAAVVSPDVGGMNAETPAV